MSLCPVGRKWNPQWLCWGQLMLLTVLSLACSSLEGSGRVDGAVDAATSGDVEVGPVDNPTDATQGPNRGDGAASEANVPAEVQHDIEPPAVIMASPADGALGVTAETKILMQFSEGMDKASVESALTVAGANFANFSWNSTGTILEVGAEGGWPYAEGSYPPPAALRYQVRLSAEAQDLAGNKLAAPLSFSFTTLRRSTIALNYAPERSGQAFRVDNDDQISASACNTTPENCLFFQGPRGGQYTAIVVVTFSFNPPIGFVAVDNAWLQTGLTGTTSAPPNSRLEVETVEFTSLSPALYKLRGPLAGTFSLDAPRPLKLTVADILKAKASAGMGSEISFLISTPDTVGYHLAQPQLMVTMLLR
jgi:hypothetical protein